MTQRPSLDEIAAPYKQRLPRKVASPGLLEDLWEGVKDYARGARQDLEEIGRAREAVLGNIRPIANPIFEPEPGSPNYLLYYTQHFQHVKKDVPFMNDEEQRLWNWYIRAGENFRNNTLAPAAATVAAVAAPFATLAGAGVLTGTAATVATTASLAYTPFMASDIADSVYERGWGETAKNTALSMIPFYESVSLANDPEFQRQQQKHPGQALFKQAITGLEDIAPFSHSIGKAGRKVTNKSLSKIAQSDKAVNFMYDIHFNQMADALVDLRKRVNEGKVQPQPLSKEGRLACGLIQAEEAKKMNDPTTYNSVMSGQRSIPVAPSTLEAPVRGMDIMKTFRNLASIRAGRLRLKDKGILGYFERASEAIRVRGRVDFETMGHELGHKLDKMFEIKQFDTELIDLYHKTWTNNPYPPSQHRGEGIAEFTRTFLLNPEEAKNACPGYYAEFTKVLADNPVIKARLELLSNQVRKWYYQEPGARVRGIMQFVDDKESKDFKDFLLDLKKETINSYTSLSDFVKAVEERLGHALDSSENPLLKAKALLSYANGRTKVFLREKWSPEYQNVIDQIYGKGVITQKVFWADVWASVDWKEFNTKYEKWLKDNNFKDLREAFTAYMTAKHFLEISDEMTRRERKEVSDRITELTAIVDAEKKDYDAKVLKQQEDLEKHIKKLEKKIVSVDNKISKRDNAWSNKRLTDRLENAKDNLSNYLKSLVGQKPLKKHQKEIKRLQKEIDAAVKDIENDKTVKRLDLEKEKEGYKREITQTKEALDKLSKQMMKPTKAMRDLHRLLWKLGRISQPDYRKPYKTPLPGKKGFEDYAAFVNNAPKEFVGMSTKYRAFNENVLSLMEYYDFIDSGLKQVLLNSYSDYVPLQRLFEIDEHGVEGLLKIKDEKTTGSILHKLSEEGSDRWVIDPFHEYDKMINHIITLGEKNKVNQSIVDLSKKVDGMGDYFHFLGEDAPVSEKEMTFAVWYKGQKQVYHAIDPHLYEVLKVEQPRNIGKLMKTLASTSQIFREGVTSSPSFIFRQVIKDMLQAFINSKSKKLIPLIPIVDSVEGSWRKFSETSENKQLRAEFQFMGVPYSTYIKDGRNYKDFVADTSGRKIHDGIISSFSDWFIRTKNRVVDKTMAANQFVEELPRIQEFHRIRKEGGSLDEAAKAAREITVDFTQAGTAARRWNKYIPFLNATLQGHKNMYDTLITNKETRQKAWLRLGLMTLASLTLWYANKDEEWYKEIDYDLKNRFWLIRWDDNQIIRLPKPEGYGIFMSSLERLLDYYEESGEEAPASLYPYLMGVLKPTILPPLLDVIYESTHNWDSFRNKPIVPAHLQKVSPEYQYDDKTSYLARGIGTTLGWSPMKIEHGLRGLFGTVGKEGVYMAEELFIVDETKPERNLDETSFTFGFLVDSLKNSQDLRDFFEILGEEEIKYNDAKKVQGNKAKKPKHWTHMQRTKREISALYKEIRHIEDSTKYTPAQKTAKIKQKRREIVDKAKKAKKKYQQTK